MTGRRIQNFLEKYYRLSPPHGAQKKAVARAIASICKTRITEDFIVIKQNTAYIYTDAATKNFIYLHKRRVLNHLHKNLNITQISNIQ